MAEEEERAGEPKRDERATDRPAADPPESEPAEHRDPDPVDAPGPLGNPGSDEESLRHRQQEEREPDE